MRSRLFGHTEDLSHLPTVLVMGRTNVGKSTLFNRLIKRRKNIVFDEPGVTRDFLEGKVVWDDDIFRVIDTAGFEPQSKWSYPEVQEGLRRILKTADVVLYVVDGREEVNPTDREAILDLKRQGKPFIVVVNKIESPKQEASLSAFYELGASPLYPISSEHALGISDLMDAVIEKLPARARVPAVELEDREAAGQDAADAEQLPKTPNAIRVALVGRPNVGKSTLCNALFGAERAVVSDKPGTTRDAVEIIVSADGKTYRFIDTAGIRRPGKRETDIERISIAQSLGGIGEADVVLWVVDAEMGLVEQDKKVLGEILEARRPFIVLFNKFDALVRRDRKIPPKQLEKTLKATYLEECPFASFPPVLTLSAQTGAGVETIFPLVDRLYRESHTRFSTAEVNKRLEPIIAANPPPSQYGRLTRIFYATQVAAAPPAFVFFTTHPNQVRQAYRRYLENVVREELKLPHVPVQVIIRGRGAKE